MSGLAVTRRLALVTGASAGIGAAFAKEYASRGFDLALTARRSDRLEALAAELRAKHRIEAFTITSDLADPTASDAIIAAVASRGRAVDVLVNNAGYGVPGYWAGTTWKQQTDAVQVMLTAPLELSHRLLPGMLDRKWGRIVNVASLAGFTPGAASHTTYAAIKSALIRFTQSLHAELRGTGVHCTAICPGLTWSEFHDVNGTREQLKSLPRWIWQSAEKVAAIGYRAAEKNRTIVVTGVLNKIAAGLAKVTPDGLAAFVANRVASSVRDGKSE